MESLGIRLAGAGIDRPRLGVWFVALLLTVLLPSAVCGQGVLEPLYSKKVNLTAPHPPLLADLAGSPDLEMVLTDVRGRVKLLDAITGNELKRLNLDSVALSPPVFGDFTGDDSLELAIGTHGGRLVILRGSDLEEIYNEEVGSTFSLQPTVVPVVDEQGRRRDVLVMFDQDGTISAWRMNDSREMEQLWSYFSGTRIDSAMVAGSVRDPDRLEIAATTADAHIILLDVFQQRPYRFLVRQLRSIPVSPLLVDISGNGHDEVIVTLNNGQVCAFRWDNVNNRLEQYWGEFPNLQDPPVSPPTLLETPTTPQRRYVLQTTESYFYILDLRTGLTTASDRRTIQGISTQAALIPRADSLPELAFGLRHSLKVTEGLGDWVRQEGSTLLTPMSADLRHQLAGTVTTAFDSRNDDVIVIGISPADDGVLYAYRTPYVVTSHVWPARSSWMTMGATPLHNAKLARDFAGMERDRRERLSDKVRDWEHRLEVAMDEREWEEALQLSGNLVAYNPYNAEYRSIRRKVFLRRHFLEIFAGVAVLLIVVGVSTFKTMQLLNRKHLRRRAETASARGDYDEARRCYKRLMEKTPKNPKVATALADVLINQRDFSAGTLTVYGKAYHANPNNRDFLHAYARALLVKPVTDANARGIYEKGLQSFPEPQWLEYGIGRCELAAGNYEEAGKRLRSALRGGVTSGALYSALCDVYLRTGNFTAKALPVFEQQFPLRREDKEFLEAYLLAYVDGKKVDAKVESLCQAVLEVSPNFIPAYLQLAQIFLQKNQVGPAVDEITQALEIDPNNEEALTLLAQCYLIQDRKDAEALQAYRRALEANPKAKDILQMMSSIYFERGQYDQEAISVYYRCLEQSPNDVMSLRALAQAAQLNNDTALAIKTIETLMHLGQTNEKLILQLTHAYIRNDIIEPKAERVFREALRGEPANPEFLSALARVYKAQDRTDVECISIYEQHLQNYKNDVNIGRQLAKSYIKANHYEKALAAAKRFLEVAPEDEELQRLHALASLYDNKIDEAVTEYKRLLDRNPEDPDALVNLALAYGQKMRTDGEAVRYYEKALALQPDNGLLHLAMARVSIDRNDAVKAVESYKEALRVKENNEQNVIAHIQTVLSERPEILRLRWYFVEILVAQGLFREALEQIDYIASNHPGQASNILKALETILGKDPKNVTALVQKGATLISGGKPEEAAVPLEKAYKLRPTDPVLQEHMIDVYTDLLKKKDHAETRFRLGQVYFARQEYDHAIGCFQQTAQDYRWEAESTKMLGRCFTAKGMLDLALQEFKKLVVDAETKELLYELAQRYEGKKDLVGAKTVYRQLFAADINYKDVKQRFEMLSGSTSDPMAFEKTSIVQQMSEEAVRRYELLDELGRGAMGIVYRARDKELDEVVALKILPDNMSNNPEAVRRFKIEARNARKLSHPNIVRIHDIGEEMGRKYISMEYVDGSDLKKKVKSAADFKIPVKDAIKYLMAVADALAYAHRLGIVHRDIKPANIMLTGKDEVKVTDFGIAKMMDQTGEGTMIGAVIGTPLYMSPEQVQGMPVDNRADIYSLGILMYELLSGQPPFVEGDLAYQHIHREPDKIEGVPDELWRIVKKCLEKKKEDRWERAEDIYDALREFHKTTVA